MSIWVILSDYLIAIVQLFIQQAIILRFAKIDFTLRKLALSGISVMIVYILLTMVFSSLSYPLILCYMIILAISYRLIFIRSAVKSVVLTFTHLLFTFLIENIGMLVFTAILSDLDMYNYKVKFLFRLLITMLLLLIFLISIKSNLTIPIHLKHDKYVLAISYLVFLFLIAAPNILYMEQNRFIPYSMIEVYNIILFLLFFAFNLFYIRSLFKITDMSQQLEMQKLYTETLKKSTTDLRLFKHDYDNTLMTIEGYAMRNDINGLEAYLKELHQEFSHVNKIDYIDKQFSHIPILYGIVLSKYSLSVIHGIEFNISITCEIKLRYCSSVDFSRIVGILLDNAIDSALKSKRKYMEMTVTHNMGIYTICFTNSCDTNVDTIKIFDEGYTTTEGHTGLGLHEVLLITQKYQRHDFNMDVNAEILNGMFIFTLTI